ncbi:MAG: PfkB family carbohydrate kinase [Planctomycetes bacterium]|jgi:sugar/nucleoside kinase (ribokinase family)|nr:PfkB family carbohydrate kinase [Planctomycetota bacterium]
MPLLVVGSIAFDHVQTPHGEARDALGGSGVYFSCAASLFGPVRLVGVVGRDFPEAHLEFLSGKGVDVRGVVRAEGDTFRWSGRYTGAMNEAETLDVRLNVFGDFRPEVPEPFRDSDFVFLANASPRTQLHVLDQLPRARFTVADTMNLWIRNEREALDRLVSRVDALFLNEGEARQYTGKTSLVEAGEEVLARGPKAVVVKKGEHGALLFTPGARAALPAFPVSRVVDPTGAGDSFAGGFMGTLAAAGKPTPKGIRKALAHATVVASFVVEDFSPAKLSRATPEGFRDRVGEFRRMLRID